MPRSGGITEIDVHRERHPRKEAGQQDTAGLPLRALPDICACYAGDAAAVSGDQVQSYRCILVRGWVCSAFKEKFLEE